MKTFFNRVTPIVAFVLLAVLLLAACGDEPLPRLVPIPTYDPGPAFSTNFNYEDPRRQVKCSVVFEVVDEQAVEELAQHNFKIRNSILSVLGELTLEEITTERDLNAIAARIVERANIDLNASHDLIVGAYFTDFAII